MLYNSLPSWRVHITVIHQKNNCKTWSFNNWDYFFKMENTEGGRRRYFHPCVAIIIHLDKIILTVPCNKLLLVQNVVPYFLWSLCLVYTTISVKTVFLKTNIFFRFIHIAKSIYERALKWKIPSPLQFSIHSQVELD